MGDVIELRDGYGGPIGMRYPMPTRPGSHVAYVQRSDVVVEWYDFGDHAPYKSANLLIFDRPAQERLAEVLDCPFETPHRMAYYVALRCDSYSDVRRLADAYGIAYEHQVDFWP